MMGNIPNPIESAPAFQGRFGPAIASAYGSAILHALGVEPVYQPRHHNGYQRRSSLYGMWADEGQHRKDPDELPPGSFRVVFADE